MIVKEIGAHYVLVTYVLAGAQLISKSPTTEDVSGINLKTLITDSERTREKGQEHRTVLFEEVEYDLESKS